MLCVLLNRVKRTSDITENSESVDNALNYAQTRGFLIASLRTLFEKRCANLQID